LVFLVIVAALTLAEWLGPAAHRACAAMRRTCGAVQVGSSANTPPQ
jgi:hypothetical protein